MQLATEEQLVSENSALIAEQNRSGKVSKTPEELAQIVSRFASSDGWLDKVRLRTEYRWYERLYQDPDYDIWAISWMPEQSTGFHDHGESAGAFVVAAGSLEEHRPNEQPVVILPGQPRAFDSDYAHDVRNVSLAPAISIHAYSPPLNAMNEYELDGDHLVPRESATERAQSLETQRLDEERQTKSRTGVSNIGRMLLAARSLLRRVSPAEAHEAMTETEAILVDIRPEGQRAIEGSIPGALVVERNVLEWRFDPTSSARLPIATNHDLLVVVFCSEGYTSSLAAVALQDIGLWRATDMVGGFHAWRVAGLPVLSSINSTTQSCGTQG